eukprot:TRINITY_DN66736_c0_g1_i1.p1 TRINITY_DN66736_c0_g1~~TRINITY_DN66736_c0_g1_i1.p1  ORF type:complete len:168 (+),score=23.90 TRINITY_DN66736_c0_g1_i1:96-599(+)
MADALRRCPLQALVALMFTVLSVQAALVWQDCGLEADVYGIELQEYGHSPDPIIIGKPYNITRRFRSRLDRPIHDLTERFWGTNRTAPEVWGPTFERGPFSRCGNKQYQTSCPLAPGASFAFAEGHPSTHAVLPGEHRAVEHYFADGIFVGCAVDVYSYAAGSQVVV